MMIIRNTVAINGTNRYNGDKNQHTVFDNDD